MGLLTQSLFKPIQEWIQGELGTPPGATAVFRFDRFGVTLTDADFMLPGHPELGFSPEMAIERFSDLVNRTPVELGTGDAIALTEIDIDTSYFFRIVNPAEPSLPANLSGSARQRRIEAFDVLKAEALKLWEKLGLTSVTGQIRDFRPSTPEPINWYDPANAAGWQPRTFTVTGSDQAPPSAALQWRKLPSDAQIEKSLRLTAVEAQKLPTTELLRRAARLQRGDPVAAPQQVGPIRLEILNPFLRPGPLGDLVNVSLSDRVLAKRRVLEDAPVQPTTTSSKTTITFDACLVRIDRPWLFWPFLLDATWDVPGIPRGGVTQPGTIGALDMAADSDARNPQLEDHYQLVGAGHRGVRDRDKLRTVRSLRQDQQWSAV